MKYIQSFISKRKPILFENSFVPKLVGFFAPIEPFAVSFGPFVFCREKIPPRTLVHETIHYHQQLELLFVFHWLLYLAFFIIGLVKETSGGAAYRQIPFEREAFDNDENENYLSTRPLYSWVKYL